MGRYGEKDIAFHDLSTTGDLIFGSPDAQGLVDFKLTEGYESARQDISNRARTQTGDWRSHPRIGGDLELLEGEPNTRETANTGVSQLRETLTYDGRFDVADLTVRAVPASIYGVDFYCFLEAGQEEPIIVKEEAQL